jgi:hypothetical protein
LKAKTNLFIYTFDLAAFFVMQSYLEWKKFQFKRGLFQHHQQLTTNNNNSSINDINSNNKPGDLV